MVEKIKAILTWLRRPENLYVSLALVSGILIAIILPPFKGPDEAAHIFRVYEFSKGDLLLDYGKSTKTGLEGNGFRIPDHITRVNDTKIKANENDFHKQTDEFIKSGTIKPTDGDSFEIFEGAGVYSPLSYAAYLPSAVIAKDLNGYFFTLILRISGLIVSILLIYLAVRITPLGKWLFVAIGLLPMTLHQMTVISTDGLIISTSILFIASILYVRYNFTTLSRNQHLVMSSVVLATGLCISSKPGYWPILLLAILVLPNYKSLFRVPKLFYVASIVVAIGSYLAWYSIIMLNHQSDLKRYFEQANPQSTLITKREFIGQATNPITFANKFYSTYIEHPTYERISGDLKQNHQSSFMFNSFTGVFGSLSIYPPSWISVTVIGSLFIAFVASYRKGRKVLLLRDKAWATLSMVGSFILISLIFWMSWTTSDMPFIFGVQGRYFIPILATLAFLIPSRKLINVSDSSILKFLTVLFIINCYITVMTIFNHFYA